MKNNTEDKNGMADEKYKAIQDILEPNLKLMETTSEALRNQNISNYPIFVLSKLEIEMGVTLVPKSKDKGWWLHASTLEEFATKQIIRPERINNFRDIYKDPNLFHCIFVLSDLGPQFIFIPT